MKDFGDIIKRDDGSFVINNGLYHVPNIGEFQELYKEISDYAKANPNNIFTEREWIDLHQPEPPTPPTIEELTEQFINLIQQRLDEFAQTRGYDNILSACTYVSSTVPLFQAEGQYCVEMRDATWMTAYGILGEVITGIRPILSWPELEEELPALEWPVEGGENRG